MTSPTDHPKIYHITHVENLPSIIRDGDLESRHEDRGPVEWHQVTSP